MTFYSIVNDIIMVTSFDDDLKVERVEVKDVRVPEQLIQASFLFAHFLVCLICFMTSMSFSSQSYLKA